MNRLAISSLCFLNLEKNFYTLIKKTKINNIELAPTMVCKKLDIKKFKNFKKKLEKDKKKVVALQSIFFNSNINIEDKNFDKEFLKHMNKILNISKLFNCKIINFGSADLREFKKEKNINTYLNSLKNILTQSLERNKDLNFNIEPIYKKKNKKYLLANYYDCISFVKNLNLKNLRVVYDNGIAASQNFKLNSSYIRDDIFGHVQLNGTYMSPINLRRYQYLKDYFTKNKYKHYFSIESYFNKKTYDIFLKKHDLK